MIDGTMIDTKTLAQVLQDLAERRGIGDVTAVSLEPRVEGHDTPTLVVRVPDSTFARAFRDGLLDGAEFGNGMAIYVYEDDERPFDALLVAVCPS